MSTPATTVSEATRFHPLFLYESISGIVGALFVIWLGFRLRERLRPGDLFLVFLVWYGATRLVLETLRQDNWTFFGVPVAQIISLAVIVLGVGGLAYRHLRAHAADRPAANPQGATWGALGAAWMLKPIDEPWANLPPAKEKVDWDAVIDAEDDEIDGDDDIDASAAEPPPPGSPPGSPSDSRGG